MTEIIGARSINLREPHVQIESGVSYLPDDEVKSKGCSEIMKRKCGKDSYKNFDRKEVIRMGTAATTAAFTVWAYCWLRTDYSVAYITCCVIAIVLAIALENLRHFKVIHCKFKSVLVIIVFQSVTLLILTTAVDEKQRNGHKLHHVAELSVYEVLEDINNRHEAANAATAVAKVSILEPFVIDPSNLSYSLSDKKLTVYGLDPRVLWDDPSQLQWYPGRRLDIMNPERVKPDEPLTTISVVVIGFNEHAYVERTIASIKEYTHQDTLYEIILVDDHSEPALSTSYKQEEYKGLVKYIHNDERIGLIKSRTIGANMATGDIIVFFDCHVKPKKNWESPIIQRINENYRHVVVPAIPILDGDKWEQKGTAVGFKMMMDWSLGFHWFEDGTDDVPIMSGGLLSISNRWWHESGEYDTGMEQWGSENIEQSLRVWLCGGEITVARESHVLHLFRPTFPYKIDGSKTKKNKDRLLATWFDQYLPYSTKDTMEQLRKKHDVTERLELKENLDCKNIGFWVERFREVLTCRGMIGARQFQLKAIYYGDEIPRIEIPSEPTAPAKESIMTTITDSGYCLIPVENLYQYFALVANDQHKMKETEGPSEELHGNAEYKVLLMHYTPEYGRLVMKDVNNSNIEKGLTVVPCSSTNDALLWRQAGEEQDNLAYVGINENPVELKESLKGEFRCLNFSDSTDMNVSISQCLYNKFNPSRDIRKYNNQTIQFLNNSTMKSESPPLTNDDSSSVLLKSNITGIDDLGSFQIVGNYKKDPSCLYAGTKDEHDKILFSHGSIDIEHPKDELDYDFAKNPKTFTVVNKTCNEVIEKVSWAQVNMLWRPIDVVGPRTKDAPVLEDKKKLRGSGK